LLVVALTASVATATPPVRSNCDADRLEAKARDSFAKGFFAQAFSEFEKTIQCKSSEQRMLRAVISACKAWPLRTENGREMFKARAKRYFDRLSKPNQDKVVLICTSNDDRGLFDRE
jgi:hypothetical protein